MRRHHKSRKPRLDGFEMARRIYGPGFATRENSLTGEKNALLKATVKASEEAKR